MDLEKLMSECQEQGICIENKIAELMKNQAKTENSVEKKPEIVEKAKSEEKEDSDDEFVNIFAA